jgi:hypothetical protein
MESKQENPQQSPESPVQTHSQSSSDVERTQTFIQSNLAGASLGSTSALTNRPEFQVVCWPLRNYWKKTWAILVSYFLGACAVYSMTTNPLVASVVLLALVSVSWRLWIPMQYSIGPTGITRSVLGRQRQLGWTMIRRISQDSRGIQVFFDRAASIQSILHSFYITADADDLESLIGVFHYYLRGRSKRSTL